MEINFLQITYSSCAVALRYQRLKNLRLVVLASQKLTAWSEEGARGREMGELPGSMGGGGVGGYPPAPSETRKKSRFMASGGGSSSSRASSGERLYD